MLAVALNNNDKYLLQIIYKYGGYIRANHLAYLYPSSSTSTHIYKLEKLVKTGYLIKRRYCTASKREPVTYQITSPGCIACGNSNSTYRRKRPVEYAVRALIKNIFCLEIHDNLESNLITNLNTRRKVFEDSGFITEYFPQKLNYGKDKKVSAIVQFEELNLDFRSTEGKVLKNNGETLYSDTSKSMIVVHIDQSHVEIKKQLNTLVNRYINMINQYLKQTGFPINFLVVTDDSSRKLMYENEIKELIAEYQYTDKISQSTTNLYKEFYEKLSKKDSEYTEVYNNILANNESGILTNQFIDRAKQYKVDVANPIYRELEAGLKSEGISFIVNKLLDAVKQQTSIEVARRLAENYFEILFYLEYVNIIKIDGTNKKDKYVIKVYCTNKCVNF
jgi:hypothetical protein